MPILACDSKNEKVVPGRSTAFALPLPLRPEGEVYCIVLSCTCCHRDAIAKEAPSVIVVHPVMRQCVREMGGIIAFTETERGRSFTLHAAVVTRESKKNTWVDGASPHQSEAGCREAQAGAQDWEIWELVAAVAACILSGPMAATRRNTHGMAAQLVVFIIIEAHIATLGI